MNKIYELIISLVLISGFTGCSSSNDSSDEGSDNNWKSITNATEAINAGIIFELTPMNVENFENIPLSIDLSTILADRQTTYSCFLGGYVLVIGTEYNYTAEFDNCHENDTTINGDMSIYTTSSINETTTVKTSNNLLVKKNDQSLRYVNSTITLKNDTDNTLRDIQVDGNISYDITTPYLVTAEIMYTNVLITHVTYDDKYRYIFNGDINATVDDYNCANGKYTYMTIDAVGDDIGTVQINDALFEYQRNNHLPASIFNVIYEDGTESQISTSDGLYCQY